MEKFTIASRIVLVAVGTYGIFQICEYFKAQMENKMQYFILFIVLLVISFWSLIDWDKGKK